ncbi:hypothetical protein XvhCFBP2543_21695 [Xanthomonas vasicola]|uniref:Uncharacterized protein n=1 Tax=Xanthomonas vasicola TaxID=56459 RepID=A0ABD7S5Y7_XANVA|nr:hypothetical protein NX81_003820 [Xanthomonas vasicola]PPV00580.1 hypothetical protein XvhCFBP2543_21695 [Xanthomonas vasicola]TWQ26889.1 hypothetical protein FQJ97_03415 [Xanthomonas vasicola]TWQ33129.1 hypothetical protein FQJ96_21705 [Xanthomonas vasicola]TWQ49522.1 hypothetical protein FQK01_21650 [Xanthomonas vasicola]
MRAIGARALERSRHKRGLGRGAGVRVQVRVQAQVQLTRYRDLLVATRSAAHNSNCCLASECAGPACGASPQRA